MIVVDVETTGLDPARHAIVSIGAVDFLHPEREFYAECRPWVGAEITDQALEVNGFSREQLQDPDRPTLWEAITDFNHWSRQCDQLILAGQHVTFDVGFLHWTYRYRYFAWRFGRRTVDLHAVAYCRWLLDPQMRLRVPLKNDRTSPLSLDAILSCLGLPPEPKPHNALTGARCAAEAFRRLMPDCPLPHQGFVGPDQSAETP